MNYGKRSNKSKGNSKLDSRKAQRVLPRKKIGRNDNCSCGSGKKYKNCCLFIKNFKIKKGNIV